MFLIDCPGHGTKILLGARSVESMHNTSRGIEVRWRCRCGARGVLITGLGRHAGAA
ncbi:MAG: hypothetical protein ACRD0A_09405 [Acidimicrobiales bacterium]